MQFPLDIVITALLTGGALALEHLLLYQRPRRLSRPAAFVVGTVTIYIGLALWLFAQGPFVAAWRVMAALSLIIAVAGIVVLVAYALRKDAMRRGVQATAIQQVMREAIGARDGD